MNEKSAFEVEKKKPIANGFVPLGQGKGINWTLWGNNVTFQRREKLNDEWHTTEELHATPSLIREIAWRASHWLARMEKEKKK